MKTPLRYGLAVLVLLAGSATLAIFSAADAPQQAAEPPAGVTMVERGDVGMNAAMRMGRESLPEMLRLLEKDSDVAVAAMVKLRYEAGEDAEYIWAQLSHETEEGLVAQLQSDPVLDIGDYRKGSFVPVDVSKIVDWSFRSERTSYRGDFTGCYLLSQGKHPTFAALAKNQGLCAWAEAYRTKHATLSEQIPR